jgi:hypothetical protein
MGRNQSVWSWLTHHQMLLDTINKNTWFRGGDFICFWDIWAFPKYQRGQNPWPTYHQMLLDTINNNIYGLGVGVSMVFEIIGHFLFKRYGTNVRSWLKYHQMLFDTTNKNMYGFGVGISKVIEKNWALPVYGGKGPPRMVMTYIPSHTPWHKELKYIQFWVENSTVFKIKKNSLHPTPEDDDFNKLAFVKYQKTFMQIWALWASWFLRRPFRYVPFIRNYKFISTRRIISFMYSSILQRIWLNFMVSRKRLNQSVYLNSTFYINKGDGKWNKKCSL